MSSAHAPSDTTGRIRSPAGALYGADFDTAGLLHGKILRSPHAHARIKSIDTSKAEALPGVSAIVTAKDLPSTKAGVTVDFGEGNMGLKYLRDNILASDKALYKGHAIAGVAASSPHVAEEAVALIDVQYEVLEPVLTAPDGMKEGAPLLHENLKTEELGEKTDKVSNLASHFRHTKGDLDKGLGDADVVVEREFNTTTVHQGYIEPHPATALWNEDGRLHIWCSTQGAFVVRDSCAQVLDMPVSQIRVVPMEIGGGFGGKINVYLEPVAALLSKKTGHPVKIVMSRADVFEGTGPTPGSYLKVKIGAKNDGTITAAHAYIAFEAGAYPGSPVGAAGMCVFSAYDIDNVVIDGYDVVVNKPKTAAYRAPGAPNAAFAAEQVVDELANKLGMDPIDLRLQNAAKEGTRRADGPVFPRIGCVEGPGGYEEPSSLQCSARRPKPRPWGQRRLLVQHRIRVELQHFSERRRDHQPRRGVHGHRRHKGVHRHAGRRGAGDSRRGRSPVRCRYRLGGIHGRYRR